MIFKTKIDGFAKSPSADDLIGFSANAYALAPIIASQLYVAAAYLYVRLTPQLSQALHLELFALPSNRRVFASASKLMTFKKKPRRVFAIVRELATTDAMGKHRLTETNPR
jgi:hypothetical protein